MSHCSFFQIPPLESFCRHKVKYCMFAKLFHSLLKSIAISVKDAPKLSTREKKGLIKQKGNCGPVTMSTERRVRRLGYKSMFHHLAD